MKLASLRLVAIVAILFTSSLLAQVATGTPPFGSFGGGTFDTINLGNLNVHFEVPIVAKAGRGLPFTYKQAYDSSVYRRVGVSWQPDGNWGWHVSSEALTGWVEYASATDTCVDIRGNNWVYTYYEWNYYHDQFGVSHRLSHLRTVDTIGLKCNPATGSRDGTATTLDGSNYTLKVSSSNIFTVTPPWGGIIWPSKSSSGSVTDANGNTISTTGSVFTDTLGQTVLTVAGTAPSPVTLTYTAPGSVAKQYTVNYTVSHVRTAFNCSGVNEYDHTNIPLITSIVLPDNNGQYTFAYEGTPNAQDGAVTGRIASVTLPSGGTITYSYTGGSNGIICDDGSTAGLNRATPDGTTQYSRSGSGTAWTTTITDASAAHNQTNINFQTVGGNFYETLRTAYSGSGPGVLLTTYTCYNGATPDCSTAAITLPIARRAVTTKLDNNQQSKLDTFYDTYGRVTEVDEYDFGSGAPGAALRKTFTTYASLSNGISTRASSVIVKDGGGVTKASATYGYDETGVTATSGVPQHGSVTGSRGNLTSISRWVSGSDYLTQQFTYFDTGLLETAKENNDPQTTSTFAYADCGGSFLTAVSLPLSLSRSAHWDCDGGVQLWTKDENDKETDFTYDSLWRTDTVTDPLANTKDYSYSAQEVAWALNFNGNNSQVGSMQYLDGLGRTLSQQRRQSPGSSTFDTVSYQYEANGRLWKTSLPCATAYQGTCPTAAVTNTYDALNRPLLTTDSGGGTVSYSYLGNDVLVTIGPAASGENTKRKQYQYDGLGRLSSVCEITSASGSGTCNQTSPQSGYWTQYTYDVLGNMLTVAQNLQGTAQNRSFMYDGIGRMISETNPESGTTSYTFDSATGCSGSYPGDLVKKQDARGNITCYTYDKLHRLTTITYPSGPDTAATPMKVFYYDAPYSNPNTTNTKGRLASAGTCQNPTCAGAWFTLMDFSYSANGEVIDTWQLTPHSGNYFHLTSAYWPHGAMKQLSGLAGLPTLYFGASDGSGLDGQGRLTKVTAASGQNPVNAVSYDSNNGTLTGVTYGSSDFDTFSYDTSTLRLTSYAFSVGNPAQTNSGTLTWNQNGSLQGLVISDQLNSANSQTCAYQHDDLSRISNVNCGTAWQQAFGFDVFGNITKTTSGPGQAFTPTYNAATNRISGGYSSSYDDNGNLTNDGLGRTYGWDADGHPVTISDGSTSVTVTYDAFGRAVENVVSGAYTQIVYAPDGSKLALMNGSSNLLKAFVSLPGGAQAVYSGQSTGAPAGYVYCVAENGYCAFNGTLQVAYGANGSFNYQTLSNGTPCNNTVFGNPLYGTVKACYIQGPALAYYRHGDWLGTSRLATTPSRTVYFDGAYAPYGEDYAKSGTTDLSFTAQTQDTVSGVYDFLYRRYNPVQGRWMSPDPAGLAAVDPANPQTWNRYAYVDNNPMTYVDPSGLEMSVGCGAEFSGVDCGGAGAGWFGTGLLGMGGPRDATDGCPAQYAYCDPSIFLGVGIALGGHGGGGGGASGSPSSSAGSSGGHTIGGGETLGMPNGLPLRSGSIWSMFLPINTQCDFGACIGWENDFQGRTPAQGEWPFAIKIIRDAAGKIIQIRIFDWAGRAWKDIDFGHNHGAGDPHQHRWDWRKDPPRLPGVPVAPASIPGPFPVMIDPCLFYPGQAWCSHQVSPPI